MKTEITIIVIILITCITGYQFWPFLWPGMFSQAMALTYLLTSLLLILLSKHIKGSQTLQRFLYVYFWLTVNNMADELFFDPLKFGWNELAFAIIIIVNQYLIYRDGRAKQRGNQHYS